MCSSCSRVCMLVLLQSDVHTNQLTTLPFMFQVKQIISLWYTYRIIAAASHFKVVVHFLLKNITALAWNLHSLSYYLLLQCWDRQPEKRPNFSQLLVTISTMLEVIGGYLVLSTTDDGNSLLDRHSFKYNLSTLV